MFGDDSDIAILLFLLPGSQQLSAVVTFTLAMFSQLVQQVIHHIQDSVFSISFPPFTSPPTTTSSSLELNLTVFSPGDCNIRIASDTVNVSQQPSDQSSTCENSMALVNGCAGENDSQDNKAVSKKKSSKQLQRLRRPRRRRRMQLNSPEDSDLSEGNFLLKQHYLVESWPSGLNSFRMLFTGIRAINI